MIPLWSGLDCPHFRLCQSMLLPQSRDSGPGFELSYAEDCQDHQIPLIIQLSLSLTVRIKIANASDAFWPTVCVSHTFD